MPDEYKSLLNKQSNFLKLISATENFHLGVKWSKKALDKYQLMQLIVVELIYLGNKQEIDAYKSSLYSQIKTLIKENNITYKNFNYADFEYKLISSNFALLGYKRLNEFISNIDKLSNDDKDIYVKFYKTYNSKCDNFGYIERKCSQLKKEINKIYKLISKILCECLINETK